MLTIFKTVLMMSGLGFCLTALLLILKPVTSKRFPAKWQYYAWIAVLVFMLVPVWRFIPQKQASSIIHPQQTAVQDVLSGTQELTHVQNTENVINNDVPIEYKEIRPFGKAVKILDFLACIWLCGMCVFLLVVIVSYAVYLRSKRKNAVTLLDNAVLEKVKAELGIKRRISLRMSSDIKSPLLCGVLFPVVYLPCTPISDDMLRMVFLHELTHYKRKDLIIKWLAVFVNAVHWFNPLAYLLTANVGEACEISCDMDVTRDMDEAEQRLYMRTILDLV